MGTAFTDRAILLDVARIGEALIRVDLLTELHGRYAGAIRGGGREAGGFQPGDQVAAQWQARLPEQLGRYRLEALDRTAPRLFDRPAALAMLQAACALLVVCLPERQPLPAVFFGTRALFDALPTEAAAAYARWELGLCAALGVGLDLSACAVTGTTEGLSFVSPKTLRAVSAGAAIGYEDRLLRLPAHLLDATISPDDSQMLDGLRLTGYALEWKLLQPAGRTLPPARLRLEQRYRKA